MSTLEESQLRQIIRGHAREQEDFRRYSLKCLEGAFSEVHLQHYA
jgi:hypothetical protein